MLPFRWGSLKALVFRRSKTLRSIFLQNMTANHRARDCLVLENQSQVISARFVYGLLDMVNLTGEKVDLYAMLPVSGTLVSWYFRKNSNLLISARISRLP